MVNVTFEDALIQFLQPYFFYSLAFLAISFASVKIFLKFNPYLGRRARSIFRLIPLFVPAIVMVVFHPETTIRVMDKSFLNGNFLIDFGTASTIPLSAQPALPQIQFSITQPPQIAVLKGVFSPTTTIPSVVGILCLAGAAVAAAYFVLIITLGHSIAARVFHVITLSPEEYKPLQTQVHRISHELGIPAPKVGIVEDLRPNAFTLGHGQKTTLVFSLGLLNMLNNEELTAVAAHELAHIRAKDFFFKTSAYSLNMLSFFNPLSYLAASEALKERELLADERGAKLLSQPRLMAEVLLKIGKVLQALPQEHLANRLSASLFLVSPLARRPHILVAHPQITHRVHNIVNSVPKLMPKPARVAAVAALSLLLIFAVGAACFYTISLQSSFLPKNEIILVYGIPNASSPKFIWILENRSFLQMEPLPDPTFITEVPADNSTSIARAP